MKIQKLKLTMKKAGQHHFYKKSKKINKFLWFKSQFGSHCILFIANIKCNSQQVSKKS